MAIYTPAISNAYLRFENTEKIRNYFDVLEFHPYALYSAGHSSWRDNVYPCSSKHRKIVVGDSGGFQIAKNKWIADWASRDCPKAKKYREKTFNWLAKNFDWFMTLDLPLSILDELKTYSFREIIEGTKINLDHWYSEGKNTGIDTVLNVLSGCRDWDKTLEWYRTVIWASDPNKDFFFRGYSFGGQNVKSFRRSLMVLRLLAEDRLITTEHKWIHFLGTSKNWQGWVYHFVEDELRRRFNPEITVTYDSASPFIMAVNAQIVTSYPLEPLGKWPIRTTVFKPRLEDKTLYEWMEERGYVTSDILKEFNIRDIYKYNSKGKPVWDGITYGIVMNHNLIHYIKVHQQLRTLYENSIAPGILIGSESNAKGDTLSDSFFSWNESMLEQSRKVFAEMKSLVSRIFDMPVNEAFNLLHTHPYINNLQKIEISEEDTIFTEFDR